MVLGYYPFGLKHKGYNNVVNGADHPYGFNGVEEQNELGLDMLSMDLRQYDPAIARWTSLDPVIHFDFSPYNAFDNNPIFFADPSGADSETKNAEINLKFTGEEASEVFAMLKQEYGIASNQESDSDGGGTDPKKKKKKKVTTGVGGTFPAAGMGVPGMGTVNPSNMIGGPTEGYKKAAEPLVEAILFISGEFALVKILQGGRWVYKTIKLSQAMKNAKWAQKTFNPFFSSAGKFAGRSVDEVAEALRTGKMSAENVPIDIVIREGNALILNTRSSAALTKAGIPRSQWNVVNRTGQEFFENQLTNQLTRNSLTSAGTSSIRQSGTKSVIGY